MLLSCELFSLGMIIFIMWTSFKHPRLIPIDVISFEKLSLIDLEKTNQSATYSHFF